MGVPRIWVHQTHKQPPGPQHVVEGEETVNIHVSYELSPEEEPPEDVHVDFRREGPEPPSLLHPYPWRDIHNYDIDASTTPAILKDLLVPLEPVPSSGTYDVRVRWTRKKRDKSLKIIGEEFIGDPSERIGQFFVD